MMHNIHRPLPLVDVADLLAAESEVDEAVEIIDGDAVLREGEPVGTHLQLGRLCLLLHRHIHQTVNAADGTLDLIAEHLQAAEVGAKEFDSYVRPCAGEHMVDAVTERLPHRDGDDGNCVTDVHSDESDENTDDASDDRPSATDRLPLTPIILLLAILVAASCSTQQNNSQTRMWHAFNAHLHGQSRNDRHVGISQ